MRFQFTDFSEVSPSLRSLSTFNVRVMEKPEWFETVEALEGAPDSVAPSSARAHTARLTQGFVLLGVAAVIAVGGFAFAQTNQRPSAQALSSVTVTSAQTLNPAATQAANSPAPAASSANSVSSGTSTRQPAGLVGGKPSITGAAAGGDDGND